MADITVIAKRKGHYRCVIELNRKIDLTRYGKYKEVQHGFILISDKMLIKLENDFFVNYE